MGVASYVELKCGVFSVVKASLFSTCLDYHGNFC